MTLDFNTICRVCLETKSNSYDLFTCYDSKRNILYCQMMDKCTELSLFKGDGFPRLICKSCCQELKRAYTFNIQCVKSDQTLSSIIDNKLNVDEIKLETDLPRTNVDVEFNADVKDEPNNYLDDPWQADDDNVLLAELTKNTDNGADRELNSEVLDEKKPIVGVKVPVEYDSKIVKKKRGRPKKLLTQDSQELNDSDVSNELKVEERGQPKKENGVYEDLSSEVQEENTAAVGANDLVECDNEIVKKKRGRPKKFPIQDSSDVLKELKIEGKKRGRPKNVDVRHQCDVCGKIMSNSCNLKQHKICHTNLRPYKCAECPATFRGYSALFQHKRIHTGETPFHCSYCPKKFARKTALVHHILTHTGEKSYSCDVCCKSFSQNSQLSTHMKRHIGDKTFLCQVCGKGFPVGADLRVHERMHNGEKPYSCKLCTKTFSTAGNLSIHVRIHKKDVRYHCKHCQRGFVTCSAYNVHVKRHLGQRDYVCDCGKTFYTSSGLKQHQVVHTGERKYECKVCTRSYSQSSHLKRHMKKEHGDKMDGYGIMSNVMYEVDVKFEKKNK